MSIVTQFKEVGKELYGSGLIHSSCGNLSVRQGERLYVTASGSLLHRLTSGDIVEVWMQVDRTTDARATMELAVHRAIYMENKSAQAVVHAHAPYSVVMADGPSQIVPYDAEGQYYCPSIPVLNVEQPIASDDVAREIGPMMNEYPVVIVARHGVFARGKNLREALHYCVVCESACRINYLRDVKHAAKNH